MRTMCVVLVAALALSCSGKKDGGGGGGGSGGSSEKPVEVEKPTTCPAGNVVKDGKCIAVVTPEKIEVVAKQQTKIDDLAKLLDKVDTVGTPIELLNAFRKLDEWKSLTDKFDKLKMVDEVVAQLDNALKTLRTFKAGLGEASARLGNLKGELDRLLKDTGVAKKLEEVRAQISGQVRSALEPLAAQVVDTIQNALLPLSAKLEQVEDVMTLTCTSLKLGGGSDKAKDLCKQAKDAFATGRSYVDDFKQRPAKLYDDVSGEIEKQLDQLVDSESKKVIDAAQAKVNAALDLPPGGSGSGSAK